MKRARSAIACPMPATRRSSRCLGSCSAMRAHSRMQSIRLQATRLDPGSFEAWHNLGLTYFRLQQYAEARAPLEKAVALRPDYYGSVVLLGATLYMLGDNDAALPVLEHANRLNPSDTQTAAVLEKLRAEKQKR